MFLVAQPAQAVTTASTLEAPKCRQRLWLGTTQTESLPRLILTHSCVLSSCTVPKVQRQQSCAPTASGQHGAVPHPQLIVSRALAASGVTSKIWSLTQLSSLGSLYMAILP
jgi:hypothetical protein